jgi:hypothetical protein
MNPREAVDRWMATRPAGLRAFLNIFSSSTLHLDRLRSFERPVYFALGGRSTRTTTGGWPTGRARSSPTSPSTCSRSATTSIPHRIEPERTARALRTHWARAGD